MDKRSVSIRLTAKLAAWLSRAAWYRGPGKAHCRAVICVSAVTVVFVIGSQLHAGPDVRPNVRNNNPAQAAPKGMQSSPDRAVLEKHHQGDRTVLRVRRDSDRHRLWVLTLDHVYVYDTHSLELIRPIRLPEWFVADFMCAPDLVVDRSGTAFVSNNVQPRVVQIGAHDFQTVEHQLRLVSSKRWDIGFGALTFGPDGTLFGLSALAASLFRIDLALGTATEIEPSQMDAAATAAALSLRAGCSPL